MRRRRWSQLVIHMALAVAGFFMLLPFGWMVLTSLTPESEVVKGGLPSRLTLQNFIHVLDTVPIGRYYVNGLIVTISTFLAQTLVCVPAAFALARIRFVGARAGLWTVLGCLMVPPQVVALPVYVFLSQLGLLDTRTGLVIPFIGSAFGVFLLRQFFLTIPQSVIDAAKLDGAGTVAMLWRILVPMSRPALVSFGIFSVVAHWNDLFWPLFVLRSTEHATVPYGIVEFISIEAGSQYGAQMAASVMAVAPLLVGFLVAQRQLIEGVALSGSQE